jgi:GPH family glycoside/pentoside/hexuronide:cation symporter
MNATVSSDPVSGATVGKLPVSLKLGWGTGAFGVAMLMNGIAVLIFFYLVGILKLEPALAGAVIFVAKLFDVVTDPIVGLWSDRYHSPNGRRRPFLLWGGLVSAISFAMIFNTPVFAEQWMTAAYVLTALCIYTLGYTLFNVPYMAMPAEMTDDYHERSSIHAYRIVFVSSGAFLAAAVAPAVLEWLGKTERSSYAIVSVVIAFGILITMTIAYFATAKARFTERNSSMTNLVEEFHAVRRNKHFLRLISVKFAQLTGVQATQAAIIFFIVQSLGLGLDILVVYGATLTITTVFAAPILVKLSVRFGKREAYYVAAGAYVIVALSWSFAQPGEPTIGFVWRAVLVGIAATGNVVLAMSMLTDIINYDSRTTGVRREGAYTALYSFVEKLTAALGPLIIGFALQLANFDTSLPADVPQGGDVDIALLFAVSWLPAAAGLLAVWLLTGYKLTEEELIAAAPANTAER